MAEGKHEIRNNVLATLIAAVVVAVAGQFVRWGQYVGSTVTFG